MIQVSRFEELGSVRHALDNGNIQRPEDLTVWCGSELKRRLGVRAHELLAIRAYLARLGLSLAPDTLDQGLALHDRMKPCRRN